MIRDRLPDFKKMTNSLNFSTESVEVTDHDEVDEYRIYSHIPDMDQLLKMYNKILHNLDLIWSNIDKMKTMTRAKNSKEFKDDDFNELRYKTIQIGNKLINKFRTIASTLPGESDYSTLGRMKRFLYYGIFQYYVIIWTKTDEFFHQYEEKLKKNLQTQARILNYDLSDEEIDNLLAHNLTNLYGGNILETEKARKTLQALKGRLCELQKLEKSIEDVHLLFIRLQTLIADQSVRVQRIENFFNDARDHIEIAAEELKQAENLKNSNLITPIIIAAVAALVITLFSWKKDKK
ncbi:syntaxin-4-like [Cochliomyia hominivorax]